MSQHPYYTRPSARRVYVRRPQAPGPITRRQKDVLDAIRRSIAERGYPPTLRELGQAIGIKSTNGVNDFLRALERKGYVTRSAQVRARGIKLTEKASPSPTPQRHRDRELDPGSVDEGEAAA